MNHSKAFLLFIFTITTITNLLSQSIFIDKIEIPPAIETHTAAGSDGSLYVAYSIKSNSTNAFYDGIQVSKYNICQEIEWTKEYRLGGDQLFLDAFLVHSNGALYLAGRINDQTDDIDLFLMKINEDGSEAFTTVYQKTFRQFIYSIDETSTGDIVLFGISFLNNTSSRNYFLTLSEEGDIVNSFLNGDAGIWGRGIVCSDGDFLGRMGSKIFKVNSDGTPVWAFNFFGISNSPTPVEVADGFVFSSIRNFNGNIDPAFSFKIDFDGNLVWVSRGYRSAAYASLGVLPNGNILCFESEADPDQISVFDLALVEFSPEGQQLSNKTFMTTYGGGFVFGNDMTILPDGDVFFSSAGGGVGDTLYTGRLNPSLDGVCQAIDNFNEDTVQTITQESASISFSPTTFDIENIQFEAVDINLDQEKYCQSLAFEFPAPLSDTTICEGDEILLSINIPDAEIEWPDGSTADTFLVSEAGEYQVQVSKCSTDTMLLVRRVIAENCPCKAVFPNAFTPDGDGNNDVFTLLKTCDVSDFQLLIYNRWGELVFESENSEEGWNGTNNGIASPMDSYIYRCIYSFENAAQQELVEKEGSLTLIR